MKQDVLAGNGQGAATDQNAQFPTNSQHPGAAGMTAFDSVVMISAATSGRDRAALFGHGARQHCRGAWRTVGARSVSDCQMSKPQPSSLLDPTDFPAPTTRALQARTRRSALTITRFSPQAQSGPQAFSVRDPDGFLVLFQLKDHPAHDFWIDGRYAPAPDSPEGSVHIVDLNRRPIEIIAAPVDTLLIKIPRLVLSDLAEEIGAAPVETLQVTVDWQTIDPVLAAARPSLLSALDAGSPASNLVVDHLGLALAGHIAHAYGGMRPHVFRTGELAPWQLTRAKSLLADNLRKEMSLPEVAEQCGLSVAHFSRAFKISTGQAPHAWLQARRLDLALDLLKGDLSLAEIAMACGYADQSHFSRLFKRATGHGPGAHRRLLTAERIAIGGR
ncbi:helix-turn-helix domain-containing protein [Caulobacter endophyticus]|uniref:helix-turn-helix domain-containing protein n=1 Tax=Caulobacter endophyticus TaxID=2172652 RepID=UPI00240F0B6D|nr:AraC family transcriptional regulator [Caulobacter endophyticus]MDG2531565.1 AraC family transcriptional regulator [Caulobacter endophyticus]